MLKQSELSAEEQAEAFRRADELFRAESEQARNARAAADAAAELGVPQEYLDRAAAQVHAEKVERIKTRRSRRNLTLAIGAGVVAIGLGAMMLRAPANTIVGGGISPPKVAAFTLPITQTDEATTRFTNANTNVTTTDTSLSLEINDFHPQSGNDFQANVGFPINQPLSGYSRVSFQIQGKGVAHTRVDLRSGRTRWNSAQLNLTPGSQRISLDLNGLIRQTQQGNQWVGASGEGPQNAQSLVFKFGSEINSPDTKGSVTISDIRFE